MSTNQEHADESDNGDQNKGSCLFRKEDTKCQRDRGYGHSLCSLILIMAVFFYAGYNFVIAALEL